jgi:adenylate kinase family enzyme
MSPPETPRLAVHITGASGSGVTTLGRELSLRTGAVQLDTDDFYWLPTEPRYTTPRDIPERLRLIDEAIVLAPGHGWILSGSIGDWGAPLVSLFHLVVFVRTPTDVRIKRLRQRGVERDGIDQIGPDGPRHAQYQEFLAWAAGYDTGINAGRSLARHEAWLAQLACPVMRVNGIEPAPILAASVLETLTSSR